jgi:hypothetical protein
MLNKKIIQDLSKEFKLPEHIVEKIVSHPYKFQLEAMKDLKPFRHPFFGVFGIKPGRLKFVQSRNK